MSKTLVKQIFYAIFYLVILGGIWWWFYSIILKPAPFCFDNKQNGKETGVDCGGSCVSCEVKKIKPLSLSPAILFSMDKTYSASAEVKNLNVNFGVKNFDYLVDFYDESGKKLASSVKNNSFIYAGETKNIIEAGMKITEGIPVRAEIGLDEKTIQWQPVQNFIPPQYSLKEVKFNLDSTILQAAISGTVSNANNFLVSRIILSAFLVDKSGIKIGVSKTELQNFDPFLAENFKINFPVRKSLLNSLDPQATLASLSVEVLK